MSTLVVVGFPTAKEAEEVRQELAAVQREQLISLEDAVVVERDAENRVHLRQAVNLTAAGAVGGGFWGTLVGLLFLNPLLGAAVGAGIGAASGSLSDIGIDDGFLRELGDTLPSGSAALCVLLRDAAPDRVIERLRSHAPNARLLRTNLSHTDEETCVNCWRRRAKRPRPCASPDRPHLEAGAPLAQGLVDGADQFARDLPGHLLSRHGDRGGSLLQGLQQIGPEPHQPRLFQGLQSLGLKEGGHVVAMPEGLVVVARLLAEGESALEGVRAGLAAAQPQPAGAQQLADQHRRHAVVASEVGEALPLRAVRAVAAEQLQGRAAAARALARGGRGAGSELVTGGHGFDPL